MSFPLSTRRGAKSEAFFPDFFPSSLFGPTAKVVGIADFTKPETTSINISSFLKNKKRLPTAQPQNTKACKTLVINILQAFFVGMTGFEPATSSSRTKHATGLRYIPKRMTKLWVLKIYFFPFKKTTRNTGFKVLSFTNKMPYLHFQTAPWFLSLNSLIKTVCAVPELVAGWVFW